VDDVTSPQPAGLTSKSPLKVEGWKPTRSVRSSRGQSPNHLATTPTRKSRTVSPRANGTNENNDVDAGSPDEAILGHSVAREDVLKTASTDTVHSASLTPPDSSTDQPPPSTDPTGQDVRQTGASLQPTVPTRARGRSPRVAGPTEAGMEVQSSPASSNPAASVTPEPTANSPNTSPDDESTIVPETFAREKSGSRKGPEVPRRPDTPDSTQEVQAQDVSAMEVDPPEPPVTSGSLVNQRNANSRSSSPKDGSSRKPSMRIDTQTNISNYFRPAVASSVVESPAPVTGATTTPRRPQPPTPSGQDTAKRATRISSGVLQKKSVSEILGETPKAVSADSPMSSERDSLPADTHRIADRERREKDKSKLSTVVFAKPQKATDGDTIEFARPESAGDGGPAPDRDYLYTLFESKAYSTKGSGPLSALIQNAHKTLSTADHLVDYNMQTECRILKRLYQLQERGRWALRQTKRAEEAPRPTSHWDFVVDQVKWMRTDFREERKWKLVAASEMAMACAEWYAASPEDRKLLQVKVRPPYIRPASEQIGEVTMEEASEPVASSHPTPELIPSHEDDSIGDDIPDPRDIPGVLPPAAIFSLGAAEFNFATLKTPAFDKLLNELPLYEPMQIEPDMAKSDLAQRMDARWKTDIVPVSKYAIEKLRVKEYAPPVKRSRYDYSLESSPPRKTEPLPPRDTNVALFMPENKHIRDRIHPGHSFRPPSEHPMPTQTFFETRSSSQWTHTEDDELRRLVRDYSYNWSLIASVLTPKSLYTSGADRRTPWECFERWIGLEGLPADMSKTPYFKTYSGRIEAAGRHVAAQIEEAQRRAGGNVQIPPRKRTTQPVRVDRKRGQRHLAMLDAMRKLAKKRETAIQKQQHQAELQAMRKVTEVNQPKAPFKNPAEYSALRQEREQKRAEQQEMYRQQLLAHQRAAQQAPRNQGTPTSALPNGIPASAGGMRAPSGMPNGNMQVPNGAGRPHPALMGMMNGVPMSQAAMMGPQAQAYAKAQAQMQANIARGINTSPQQMRMIAEAQKVQQQQQQLMQQQNGQHSSPIGQNAGLANVNGMSNAAYMAAMANVNGSGSPGPNGNSSSPRSQNAGQALSSGHVPAITHIQNKIRERNPNMPEEEVQRLALHNLREYSQKTATAAAAGLAGRPMTQNQAAINAAMGAANSAAHAQNSAAGAMPAGYPQPTPEQIQQYQRQMHMQQAARRNGVPGQMQQQGGGPAMMAGMTNSPVMNMARPVSQQGPNGIGGPGQMSRSVTPRDQRSGSIGQANGIGNALGQQASPRPGSARATQPSG
jgi:chromatin modification-related protein VID21